VVVLTLFIGLLNLCVGYAIAVSLGYGPPSLFDAWEGLTFDPHQVSPTQPAQDTPAKRDDEAPDEHTEGQPEEQIDGAEETPPSDQTDEDGADSDESANEEIKMLDEKFVEASVLNFKVAMIKSGITLSNIDTTLRANGGEFNRETIRDCLNELQADCSAYMVEQDMAATRFRERIGELGELAAMGEDVEMTILEETAQIETSVSNLTHMDFETDLDAAGKRLLEEIHNLRTARHKLQDSQDVAFLAIARQEKRLDNVEDRLKNDPLTRMPNRIGLETTLDRWWKDGWHRTRGLCFMLFDIDRFGSVNEDYGSLCGDRIIFHIAQSIATESGEGSVVGRFSGQRFLVVLKDIDARGAAKKAEHIRLLIEQTAFTHSTGKIQLTLTGSVIKVDQGDMPEPLIERLEKAIDQARLSGPNQSYLHDGKNAKLIELPNLQAEPRTIKVS
jgi:diguanylate cyclase (GGDEF)-like protein